MKQLDTYTSLSKGLAPLLVSLALANSVPTNPMKDDALRAVSATLSSFTFLHEANHHDLV
jgi:hypothetical protein